MFRYTLQQRVIASDCELPLLAPANGAADAELVLRLDARTAGAPPRAEPWYRGPSMTIDAGDAGERILRFEDGTSFLVGADGRTITVLAAPAHYTHDDLAAYALGPVLGVALHLQGAVLLHAAAVVMRGKAIVIAGEARSGKSTTAAILHRLGYEVLADDLTEIADARPFAAIPSLPAIRLWPDMLDALYGSAAAFPDRAPSWEKKIVRVAPADGAREIAAILMVERGERPRLEQLSPRDGWKRLIATAYTAPLPDPAMHEKIFDVTAALANQVPIHAFAPPPIAAFEELGTLLERGLFS